MSIDGYVGLSHYSFLPLPTDTLCHFNILLFLDVNRLNLSWNKIVKGRASS